MLADVNAADKHEVVCELILLDVFYRRRQGEACMPEDYQVRFPEIEAAWLGKALQAAAVATPTPTVDEPRPLAGPGSRIGPYKLLQQLGEGGMGTVYLAEQTEPVKRRSP